jgi:hypothetical protein
LVVVVVVVVVVIALERQQRHANVSSAVIWERLVREPMSQKSLDIRRYPVREGMA